MPKILHLASCRARCGRCLVAACRAFALSSMSISALHQTWGPTRELSAQTPPAGYKPANPRDDPGGGDLQRRLGNTTASFRSSCDAMQNEGTNAMLFGETTRGDRESFRRCLSLPPFRHPKMTHPRPPQRGARISASRTPLWNIFSHPK